MREMDSQQLFWAQRSRFESFVSRARQTVRVRFEPFGSESILQFTFNPDYGALIDFISIIALRSMAVEAK
jgi:hypothetical protein